MERVAWTLPVIMPTIAKPDMLQQVFYDLLQDYAFKAAVVQYLLLFRNASKDEHDYKNPAEMYAYYKSATKYVDQEKQYKVKFELKSYKTK